VKLLKKKTKQKAMHEHSKPQTTTHAFEDEEIRNFSEEIRRQVVEWAEQHAIDQSATGRLSSVPKAGRYISNQLLHIY
jgi:hypothetical protein